MKNIIFLFLTISTNLMLFSQVPCPLPEGCEVEEFPYFFCNSTNNGLITKCSDNPYDEYDGSNHLKPMKLDISCFTYNNDSYKIVGTPSNVVFFEEGRKVFDFDNLQPRFEDSKNIWSVPCGGCLLNSQYMQGVVLIFLGHKIEEIS